MSKKNSSVILKKAFLNNQELYSSLLDFKIILEKIRNKNFLIAVSGGPDSLALTALAKACSYEKKYNFKFALVNHNIRANSSKEAISRAASALIRSFSSLSKTNSTLTLLSSSRSESTTSSVLILFLF